MTRNQRIKNRTRMVLNDETILRMNKRGLLIEGKINPEQIQPNSIDLTLANTWKRPITNAHLEYPTDPEYDAPIIDPRKEPRYEIGEFKPIILDGKETPPAVILRPAEFLLMASREVLNIPNGILSFVQGRSSIARIGVQTEQAGLIDAGFHGTITFEVYNETDYNLILYEGMRIAQLYFFKAMYALKPYGSKGKGSKYQEQIEATGSRIHLDPEIGGMKG